MQFFVLGIYILVVYERFEPETASNRMSMEFDVTTGIRDVTTFTFSGPADRWFAFGFGNLLMPNTYSIIIDENGNIIEYITGFYFSGGWILLNNSITLLSMSVDDNERTLTFERSINGNYTFPSDSSDIDTIWAQGANDTKNWHIFAYHGLNNRGSSSLASVSQTTQTTIIPTRVPTTLPSRGPSRSPTDRPTDSPTDRPSQSPTDKPTNSPTNRPTDNPTDKPTNNPTEIPSDSPTDKPTNTPSNNPTDRPTDSPTDRPTNMPFGMIKWLILFFCQCINII